MKTKTFLLLCLLSGIVLTQISAQNGKNGSGTVLYDIPVSDWSAPVYCQGVVVDYIHCPSFIVSAKDAYINGELVRWMYQVKGILVTSENSEEVFKLEAGFDHASYALGYDVFHGNLIGKKGNIYTFSIKINLETWEWYDIHTNCH
jgi:hypothetical protein